MSDNLKKGNNLHCEEAQTVMSMTSPVLPRYGILFLSSVLILMLVFCSWVEYPEKVTIDVILNSEDAPSFVTSGSEGIIWRIECVDGQHVKNGDVLSLVDCSYESETLLSLSDRLENWRSHGSRLESLGSVLSLYEGQASAVQSAYQELHLAWNRFRHHASESPDYETHLMGAVSGLIESIQEWKKAHVQIAGRSGKLRMMLPWKAGQQVRKGETMFVISSESETAMEGRAKLPMEYIESAHVGQTVQVSPVGFSSNEYGFLKGYVSFISPVPDADGFYSLRIVLPDGNFTSSGKEIPLTSVIHGNMDIIIRESSLLGRLLDI